MSALFWDLDHSSPPKTPPLHFARSEFRYTSSMSFYDQLQCSSPIQDNHDHLDWTSVEFTRLNPSRTRDSTGEWHMVTATRSLLGRERQSQREGPQDGGNLSYNSLPRAHFLQPNRESSAFSAYTKDIWLDVKDAQNITRSPRNSPKLHQRTQPGFYSPKTSRFKHCDATQSTKNDLKGSSTSNMKEFNAHTLPLPCSKTGLLKLSKPQKVKTSLVETPPLMRAVISQTSLNSDQPSKKHFSQQLREDPDVKNEDQSLSHLQEPNVKHCGNDPFVWSRSQPSPGRYQDFLSPQDYLSINTHLFPEHQSAPDQPATLSQNVQKVSRERFSLSVDSGIKPCQGEPEPCQPHASLIQPDLNFTQHQEDNDVRNGFKNVSQVDINSKNVFGQPRVIASLRAACSPRPVRKSTVLEDLKKLIVMNDTEDDPRDDSSPLQQKEAELCASPLSSCPAARSYPESPGLTPSHLSMETRPTECCGMPEQAESDLWERDKDHCPELMPLPNTACYLDWDSLVQAAQDYETQRMAALLSEMSPVSSRPETPSQGTYDDVFIDFPDQLSHLEAMLRRLSSDLLKEKRDKVALLAEVLKLRISNQHLREESLCAVEQLHKILNATPELEDYTTANPNM